MVAKVKINNDNVKLGVDAFKALYQLVSSFSEDKDLINIKKFTFEFTHYFKTLLLNNLYDNYIVRYTYDIDSEPRPPLLPDGVEDFISESELENLDLDSENIAEQIEYIRDKHSPINSNNMDSIYLESIFDELIEEYKEFVLDYKTAKMQYESNEDNYIQAEDLASQASLCMP